VTILYHFVKHVEESEQKVGRLNVITRSQ